MWTPRLGELQRCKCRSTRVFGTIDLDRVDTNREYVVGNDGHYGRKGLTVDTATIRPIGDIWMELKDRTLLAELMEQHKLSARALARRAGWKSHSYMNRLLAGEVKTLSTEPAARIAHELKVPFNLLFVTRVDDDSDQSGRKAAS